MTWLVPTAFAGLLALAVPILVHLFGRRQARPQPFPSLRLLRAVRPTPATRSRPSDVWLLVVRGAVIAAAVAALAQPRWTTGDRAAAARVPVRVIVVDTSVSMARPAGAGRTHRTVALESASTLLDSARAGMIVETARPGATVGGAASWLSGRSGLRELVIVSDFQGDALREGDLATIPPGIGIRLVRAGGGIGPLPDTSVVLENGVHVAIGARSTAATWPAASRSGDAGLVILAAEEDRPAVSAMRAAVQATSAATPGPRKAAVVFPRYAGRDALGRRLAPLAHPWQADVAIAMRRYRALAAASRATDAVDGCIAPGTPLARNDRGSVIASVAGAAGGDTLVLFSCAPPGSLAATAVLAGLGTSLQTGLDPRELDPSVVADDRLRQWERPATEVAPGGRDESSPDGRWLWVAALVLLGVEEWLRRRAPRVGRSGREVADARAA